MTLATTISRTSYPGTGSTGPFAFPFLINIETDLLVTKRSATGVETVLVWPADFTVTGVKNASGAITLTVAPVSGETVTIRRNPPLTQATSIRNQGSYFPATVEDTFDRLEMQLQSLADSVSRCAKLKESLAGAPSLTELEPTLGYAVTGTGTGFTMSPISSGAVALPGAGRTTTTLSAYLANNSVFAVLDFAPVGVNITTGVNDATSAILAADAAAAVLGGDVWFPSGILKHSQNLVVKRRWLGIPSDGSSPTGLGTILKPTAAVTKCIDLRSQGFIDGFYLDGVNTTGATGLDVGSALLVTQVRCSNTRIFRFLGVGARGMKVAQCVTGHFQDVYCDNNYINCHTTSGGTPTDTVWLNCQFREATTKGVWLESGYGLRFIKPLFEANGEEGLYLQNIGLTLTEITIDDAWYELNWTSVASGVARHAKYNCFVDGSNGPGGTIRFAHLCAKFLESATEARCMHITNCQGYADFNTKCNNEAGQILLDGTTQATFTAWNPQNGPYLTTVTDNTGVVGAIYNVQSHVQDNIEAAWSTYTPTVTGSGTMTIAALSISKAAYKIIGKTCTVALVMSFTTGVAGGQQVNITLPTNVRSKDAIVTNICLIADGATTVGYVFANGVQPTSSLSVGRGDLANWTLGTLRQVNTVFTFELF